MDLEKIKKLIVQGESHTLEFKKSTARLKSACETACAFLNADGGIIGSPRSAVEQNKPK